MKTQSAAGVVLFALVVGFAAGFTVGRTSSPEKPPAAGPIIHRLLNLEDENERLRQALARQWAAPTEKHHDIVGTDETAGGNPPRPLEADDPPVPAPKGAPRFFADFYGGAFGRIDWALVGRNLAEMEPLVAQVAKSVAEKAPVPPAAVGRIQQLNGPLVEAALSLGEDVPGSGVNGRFTDPGFMLNALASSLAAASLPLSSEQETALEEAARRAVASDQRRRDGYDDRTLALTKVCDEAELKDAFFRDALALLTPEQRAAVDPAETHDRLRLSLFSSAVLWAPLVEPCFFTEVPDLKKQFLLRTVQVFDLTESETDVARGIVEAWVDSVPRDLVEAETDEFDLHVMVRSPRVTAWGRHTARLIGDLLERISLDEKRAAAVRSITGVLLPLKVDDLSRVRGR